MCHREQTRHAIWARVFIFIFLILVWQAILIKPLPHNIESVESWCQIPEPIPVLDHGHGLRPSSDFSTNAAIQIQVKRLSSAVRVATESWDDNGDVDVDPRWRAFETFHAVLKSLFPKVHKSAQLHKPHRYSLVYTLKGTSNSSKPLLLAAHQDVVPAGSASRWTHPPFEPYYDGQYLWGRGSSDCKNNLIGILSAVESLLEQAWRPHRTLVLAFGFDEETGGVRGAAEIARLLENAWGQNGFEMVLDEGGMGLTTVNEVVYARPGVAERGYMDAELILEVNGGHSSQPPVHSGIGIMAEMIMALEKHPYAPVLTRQNPLRGYLECQGKFSPHEIEPWLLWDLLNEKDGKRIGRKLSDSRGPMVRFSMQTSQAVDIIRGGDKVNALPETVKAIVNYRIAPHDSLSVVKGRISKLLGKVAHHHGLKLRDFHHKDELTTNSANTSAGTLTLRSLNDLPPSPITPTDADNKVWHLFGATIRQVFQNTSTLAGKAVLPVGDIMQGNTDTIHYWNLTPNIYRFSPAREGTRLGIHTIDERVEMTAHAEGIRLYYDTILNFDNADLNSDTHEIS